MHKAERQNKIRMRVPFRYILVGFLTLAVTSLAVVFIVFLLGRFKWFYLIVRLSQILCVLGIVASDYNPDYKAPWLILVIVLPVFGVVAYLWFFSKRLKRKYVRRLKAVKNKTYEKSDKTLLLTLRKENPLAEGIVNLLINSATTHLFRCGGAKYFDSGESFYHSLLCDLKKSKKFIFLEYFVIKDGTFWSSVLSVLKEKAGQGVDVRLIYDDFGCMTSLPANYVKTLKSMKIKGIRFSPITFGMGRSTNNRNHRKMAIIDGTVAYTGGVNLADEYINEIHPFGFWKDSAVRIEGEAVKEFTKLFLVDEYMNNKEMIDAGIKFFPNKRQVNSEGYVVPFGDGPSPLYKLHVAKNLILNLLGLASEHVYICTPYLIIDDQLCCALENTARRGVEVNIVLPAVPDKKIINLISKSFYKRLIVSGVKIFEYTPGFIHAKNVCVDGKFAVVSTVNLDYRSLAHHFEDGVFFYKTNCVKEVEEDMKKVISSSELIEEEKANLGVWKKIFCALFRIVAPAL